MPWSNGRTFWAFGLYFFGVWIGSLQLQTVKALVTEPSGAAVPVDSFNGEVQLYSFFANQGETIDWQADAHDQPDIFSPLCNFTATFILKQSGSSLGVGWYNVTSGATAAPDNAHIYQIIPPHSPVGTVIASADIRKDPNYLGGDIGFALMRDPLHFSESKWNTICNQLSCAATPGPWILAVKYKSINIPNAWYLAFEDGNTSSSFWDNDGDFNDYVFLFTGITCSGAGQPCTPEGALGICSAGLTECDTAGKLVCKKLILPEKEACDGVDNDCDAEIDEGDGLCPVGEQCVRGTCVPYCGVEFPCLEPTVCEHRMCVHPDCVGVTCDKGQACIEGKCRAPCDGVKCPPPLTCRVGRCMDACAGVQCGGGLVCQNGVCVSGCACQSCANGLSCRPSDGLCVENSCLQVTCGIGKYCAKGQCMDACLEAVCPAGQVCQQGACIEGSPLPSALDGGAQSVPVGGDGGAPSAEDAAIRLDANLNTADAGKGLGADAHMIVPSSTETTYQPNCGCRTLSSPTTSSNPGMSWLLVLFCVCIRLFRSYPAITRLSRRSALNP